MTGYCEKCDGRKVRFFVCDCERHRIVELKVWRPAGAPHTVEVYAVMHGDAYRPMMRGDRRKWDALFAKFPDMLAVLDGESRPDIRPWHRDTAGSVAWHIGPVPFIFRRSTILDLISVRSQIYAKLDA